MITDTNFSLVGSEIRINCATDTAYLINLFVEHSFGIGDTGTAFLQLTTSGLSFGLANIGRLTLLATETLTSYSGTSMVAAGVPATLSFSINNPIHTQLQVQFLICFVKIA